MRSGQKVRDYVFEEKIGQGGMGEVWSAHHGLLHRKVAIKVMAPHLAQNPQFSERFLREARSQARLRHPNIVQVMEFFIEDGEHFLVLSLLSQMTLAGRLQETRGPLPVQEALRYSRDVLDALDYAHQQKVIHRDVKPSNILLEPDGHAHLTDFGIALALEGSRLTRTGTILGSPYYMSPEQIRSTHKVDHRTDVYSFGCVMYEMLTGQPPFVKSDNTGDTDYAIQEAHVHRSPQPVRSRNPQVPAWLDEIVLRALAKEPNERFGGCGAMRKALDAPHPVPVKRMGRPGLGLPRRVRPGRLLTLIVLFLLLALAILVVGMRALLRHSTVGETAPRFEIATTAPLPSIRDGQERRGASPRTTP